MVRGANTFALIFVSVGLVVTAKDTHSLMSLRADINFSASASEIQQQLVARVHAALATGGDSDIARHVGHVKDVLRSSYRSLPKNAHGRIDSSWLLHALRRHFANTLGWHISILDGTHTAGESVEGERPAYLDVMQELLRERPGQHGFDLTAMGVIATIMKHLVIGDTLSTLPHAYKARQHATDAILSAKQAKEVLALHLASHIRAYNISSWKPNQVAHFEKMVHTTYPNWRHVMQNLIEEQERLFPVHQELTFAQVARVAEEVSIRFAHWQNDDCDNTRSHLQELESGVRGRVRLGDFYDAALTKGLYQFTETLDYLRESGALDESDKLDPEVITPNYVNGRSNCVARTKYYSVCCMNVCESIFGELEQYLSKPTASTDEIILAVESTGRLHDSGNSLDLSDVLRRRLAEVSAAHGGVVIIHGRLFAQWMHLAFPRECAFPHKSGTVYAKSIEQWEKDTKRRSAASKEEMQNWVELVKRSEGDRRDAAAGSVGMSRRSVDPLWGMWNMEEELVFHGKHDASKLDSEFQRKRAGVAVEIPPGLAANAVPLAALTFLMFLGVVWKASVRDVSTKKPAFCEIAAAADLSMPPSTCESGPQLSRVGNMRPRSQSVTPELADLWERFNCSSEVFDIGEKCEVERIEKDDLTDWYQR
eukprot:TRINITY_DN5801_c0_g2_i1.p1 TRINITY_DN5801_c0_g2~~TRINITY_DN5801_c0_g2_i1.p1  ORF type:complete len:678 (-),score=107.75 TRINITY_DN5801_c0_g2_i1:31-1986(-)